MTNLKNNQMLCRVALTEPQRLAKSGKPYVPIVIQASNNWNVRLACFDVNVKIGDTVLCEMFAYQYKPDIKVLEIVNG